MLRFFEYLNSLLSAHNAIKGSAIAAVVALFVWFVFGSQIEGLFSPKAEPVRLPVVQQLQTGNFLSEQSNVSTKSATPQTQTAIESEREQKSTLVDEMKAIKKEAIQKRVQSLVSDLKRVEDGSTAWKKRIAELSTSDSGRRIVNNSKDFAAIVKLLKIEVVQDLELASLQDEAAIFEKELTMSGKAEPVAELSKALERAAQKVEGMQKAIDIAATAVTQIERQSLGFEIANQTLGEAIKTKESEKALEWATRLAVVDAENKSRSEDAEIDSKNATASAELKKKKKIDDGELQTIDADAEAARIAGKAKADRIKLEAEFQRDLPTIQHYLAPLFAKGYTQPKSASNFSQTKTTGPMSLAAIKKYGALDDPDGLSGGYAKFLHLFNDTSNDRKVRGPYPKFIGGAPQPNHVEAIRPAYLLLEKYQTLLVEKGMLAE